MSAATDRVNAYLGSSAGVMTNVISQVRGAQLRRTDLEQLLQEVRPIPDGTPTAELTGFSDFPIRILAGDQGVILTIDQADQLKRHLGVTIAQARREANSP